jgi:hypothetical protein
MSSQLHAIDILPQGKSPQYLLYRKLDAVEKSKIFLVLGIELQLFSL